MVEVFGVVWYKHLLEADIIFFHIKPLRKRNKLTFIVVGGFQYLLGAVRECGVVVQC